MAAQSCIVFGATGSVGSSLVDLLATRKSEFGFGTGPLAVVAAAPDAVKTLKSRFPESSGGGGGGSGGGGGGAQVVLFDCDANDASLVEAAFDKAQQGGARVVAVVNAMGNVRYIPFSETTGDEVAALVSREVLPAANILKQAMHRMGSAGRAGGSAGGSAGGTAGESAGGSAGGAGGDGHAAAGGNGAPAPAAGAAEAAAPVFSSSIVYRSASVTHHGMKHHEAFAAAKGAGEAMHLSAAATMAQRGVKVSVVAAGLVEPSPATEQALGGGGGGGGGAQGAHQKSAALYPPHRLARPEEVAAALAVAASPGLLPFTTGAVIACDGGLSRVAAYAAPTQHV